MPMPDWETMSLQERNLAYNNRAHVGDAVAQRHLDTWTAASQQLRAAHPHHLDLPYANGERTRWDLYPAADAAAPCMVYVHGGYWQRGSREIYACLAQGMLAQGWSVAMPGYTLAPNATLTQIVAELRIALDWFALNAATHGIQGSVVLAGWSAGGHLTALLLDHPLIKAGLALSGVYDLAGLRDSPHVNDALQLSEAEIDTLSPMRLPCADKPLAIAYGTAELPAMIRSSRQYHRYRARAHLAGDLIPVPAADHFTILNHLRDPGSHLVRVLRLLAD